MSLIRRTGFSLAALMLFACSSDGIFGSSGFKQATASFACGPADGPAVAIVLANEAVTGSLLPTPSITIFVDQPVSALAGKTWSLGEGAIDGGAWLNSVDGRFELAKVGYLAVTSVGADNTIEGIVDVTFANAGHYRSAIRTVWNPVHQTCA